MKRVTSYIKFYWIGILISLIFFIVGLLTLSSYGINIDEPIHFERGNAYLDFFLTGRTKHTDADFRSSRVSEWKYRGYDTAYFLKNDGGHPPLNGILAAATNRIFHEKLGIMGDLESYHMFELFISSMLVFLIFAMVGNRYGTFAGIVASLAVALYPLFYGESHFNIKDPIEASFFSFAIYFFYLGVEKVKGKYFFISSLFCALAFGTKFNIVFLPFIITPYLFVRFGSSFLFKKGRIEILKRIPKSVYISLFFYPIIVVGIHFLSRPYLWQDPINRFLYIVRYYKDIGTGIDYQSRFLWHGWNTYPTIFVGMSTPIVILAFFFIGVAVSLFSIRKEKDKFSFLMLLWFGITLLRVSLPGASIYGGVRQIMEYIPAMAAIAGIGAFYFRSVISKFINTKIASMLILASFIPLIITLVRLHPNENVFMNSLVGGLSGATEKKIPGAGDTMGNSYLQGLRWINGHAEKNAHYHLPVGLGSNVPRQYERSDIKFGNFFSGIRRDGEYMLEMISVDFPPPRYNFRYLDAFIEPVYEAKVDGVAVAKVWKNDASHTKKGYLKETEEKITKVSGGATDGFIIVELEAPVYATRIVIEHDSNNCINEGSGSVSYSLNSSEEFLSPDDLFRTQGFYATSLNTSSRYVYLFTATALKKITITPEDNNICLLKFKDVKVFGLKDIKPVL